MTKKTGKLLLLSFVFLGGIISTCRQAKDKIVSDDHKQDKDTLVCVNPFGEILRRDPKSDCNLSVLHSEYMAIRKIRKSFTYDPLVYPSKIRSRLGIVKIDSLGHITYLRILRSDINSFKDYLRFFPKLKVLYLKDVNVSNIKQLEGSAQSLKKLIIQESGSSVSDKEIIADFSYSWGNLEEIRITHQVIKELRFPTSGNLRVIEVIISSSMEQLDKNLVHHKQLEQLWLAKGENLESIDLSYFTKLNKDKSLIPWE